MYPIPSFPEYHGIFIATPLSYEAREGTIDQAASRSRKCACVKRLQDAGNSSLGRARLGRASPIPREQTKGDYPLHGLERPDPAHLDHDPRLEDGAGCANARHKSVERATIVHDARRCDARVERGAMRPQEMWMLLYETNTDSRVLSARPRHMREAMLLSQRYVLYIQYHPNAGDANSATMHATGLSKRASNSNPNPLAHIHAQCTY